MLRWLAEVYSTLYLRKAGLSGPNVTKYLYDGDSSSINFGRSSNILEEVKALRALSRYATRPEALEAQ